MQYYSHSTIINKLCSLIRHSLHFFHKAWPSNSRGIITARRQHESTDFYHSIFFFLTFQLFTRQISKTESRKNTPQSFSWAWKSLVCRVIRRHLKVIASVSENVFMKRGKTAGKSLFEGCCYERIFFCVRSMFSAIAQNLTSVLAFPSLLSESCYEILYFENRTAVIWSAVWWRGFRKVNFPEGTFGDFYERIGASYCILWLLNEWNYNALLCYLLFL